MMDGQCAVGSAQCAEGRVPLRTARCALRTSSGFTIAELITATEIAERAIGGLKHTVRDVNENLGSQLTAATQMAGHLKSMLAEGDGVIRRLSKIAIAARPSQEAEPAAPKISTAKAVAAAAEAFSERRRASGLAA